MATVARLRTADDRLYVCSGPKAFVAHRGWGLYRYWNSESRTATTAWVDERLTEAERMVHGGELISRREVNRLLSAMFVFRKGLLILASKIYPEDEAVQRAYTMQSRRLETIISAVLQRSRELRPVRRIESSMPFLPDPGLSMQR